MAFRRLLRFLVICRFSLRTLLIAFVVIAVGMTAALWLLREPTYPIQAIFSPVVSPSGDRIAFVLMRSDPQFFAPIYSSQLWTASVEHGELIATPAEVSPATGSISWSPDGSSLMYLTSGGTSETMTGMYEAIESLNLHTMKLNRIVPPTNQAFQLSPNGKKIFYIRDNELVIQNLQSGDRVTAKLEITSNLQSCWAPDNSKVFYVRGSRAVCEFDLLSQRERVLFAAPISSKDTPAFLETSPDGTHLGFRLESWFHTIELKSVKVNRRFRTCGETDWSLAGICYLAEVGGDCLNSAALIVYDPATDRSSQIATGQFDFPRWLDDSRILIRRGRAELWAYRVADGKGVKLFGPEE